MTPEGALKAAIEIVGGPEALAKEIGISHQAISQWAICPKDRVAAVAKAAREANARRKRPPTERQLRPDLF